MRNRSSVRLQLKLFCLISEAEEYKRLSVALSVWMESADEELNKLATLPVNSDQLTERLERHEVRDSRKNAWLKWLSANSYEINRFGTWRDNSDKHADRYYFASILVQFGTWQRLISNGMPAKGISKVSPWRTKATVAWSLFFLSWGNRCRCDLEYKMHSVIWMHSFSRMDKNLRHSRLMSNLHWQLSNLWGLQKLQF